MDKVNDERTIKIEEEVGYTIKYIDTSYKELVNDTIEINIVIK